MGKACAWLVVGWAWGPFQSSATLFWTPHLVPTPHADPVRRGFACCWGTGTRVLPVHVPAVTHPRRVRDCRDSSTWLSWLLVTVPWLVPSWLIRVSIRVGPGFRVWQGTWLAAEAVVFGIFLTWVYWHYMSVDECTWVLECTWVTLRPQFELFFCVQFYTWRVLRPRRMRAFRWNVELAAGSLTFVSPKTKVRSKTYFLF